MPATHSRRSFVLASLAMTALAGCGFKLRGPQPLRFKTIHLGMDPYSPFAIQLRREIEASGTTTIVATPAEADVRLEILRNERDREILSLSGAGTIREYQLDQTIVFRVLDRAGNERFPATALRARREYDFDDAQAIAKQREEILLFNDMERDLLQQLMRRLATVRP